MLCMLGLLGRMSSWFDIVLLCFVCRECNDVFTSIQLVATSLYKVRRGSIARAELDMVD